MIRKKIPLKEYRILTVLLNSDKEIYTDYENNKMIFQINFKDLVHTLKINPDLYSRPIVELENYGFMVRGNNIFYRAGMEAGLASLICDVNVSTLDDKHMSQFQLLDVLPEKKAFQVHTIFFLDMLIGSGAKFNTIEAFTSHLNETLKISGYEENVFFVPNKDSIVELKITNEIDRGETEKAFITARIILEHRARIRSVNGLVVNTNYVERFAQ